MFNRKLGDLNKASHIKKSIIPLKKLKKIIIDYNNKTLTPIFPIETLNQ